jgi:6-phosphogluconolactonase
VASTANHVFVSHFVAGGFAAFSTNRFGVVQNLQSVFTPTGCGPHPRQDRPHPHQVIPLPDGRLVGVDLGGDVVRHLSLDPSNGLRQSGSSALQPGAGPRNAVVLNNGDLVVANEIDNTLTYLAHDADVGGWSSLGFTSTLFESGSGLESSVGAIAASGDGRFVYVGNRGADTVAVFQVDWTRSFPLVPLMEGPVGGHRSHTMIIVDGYLYAANTRSNSLTVIPVDSETGRVLDVVQTLPIPGPMALVAL